MDHFFTRNSMGRVFGFLEVNSVLKNEKYIPIAKFLTFLDFLILDSVWSLRHDCTFLVMESLRQNSWEVTHKISAYMGHQYCIYQGGGWFSSLKWGAGTPSLLGLNYLKTWLFSKGQNKLGLKFIKLSLSGVFWNFQDCHRDFSNWCFIGWVIPSKRFSSIMAPTVWSINDL